MMVEYGPVEVGAKKYICPQRSVVTMRSRVVRPMTIWDRSLTVYAPYETMLNDIAFTNYHKFGSEARILPGFDAAPEVNPPAPCSPPPQKDTPPNR
jgi:hypothetical protein